MLSLMGANSGLPAGRQARKDAGNRPFYLNLHGYLRKFTVRPRAKDNMEHKTDIAFKRGFIAFGVVILVMLAVLLLSAGLISFQGKRLAAAAEDFIDEYYSRYNKQDYDYIYYHMTDEEYKSVMDCDSFERYMKKVYDALGPVENREKNSQRVSYAYEGPYLDIQYETSREKERAEESFTLKRYSDSWLLVYAQIEPKVLMAGWIIPGAPVKAGFDLTAIKRGAILPFDCPDEKIASMATDIFCKEFLAGTGYTPLGELELDKLLEELGIDRAGALEIDSIKKIGRALEVEAILVGYVYPEYDYGSSAISFGRPEKVLAMNIYTRIVNVEDGSILWSSDKSVPFAMAASMSAGAQLTTISKDIVRTFK